MPVSMREDADTRGEEEKAQMPIEGMLIHPDPVLCTCGYDVVKGRHAEGCPMGMFWRLAEMRTARRCAEIAMEQCRLLNGEAISHRRQGREDWAVVSELKALQFEWMANAIRREFGIKEE